MTSNQWLTAPDARYKISNFAMQSYNSVHSVRMKKVSAYIDLCFCLIVLPAMFITFPVERWVHYFPTYVICVGVWLYALYFLNRCITVPSLFKGRRGIIIGITAAVLSIAITYALASVSLYTPRPNQLDNGINRLFPVVLPYQQAVWSLFMIVETFSFAVGLLTQTTLQKSQRLAERRLYTISS